MALLKKGDENSPYYLFSQAEVNLQWAFVRIKFAQYFKAVWEIRRAYKLLEANQKKFPNFAPNKKSLGILHAMVGTVPDNYQWGMKILGMQGTIAQGMGRNKILPSICRTSRQFVLRRNQTAVFFLFNLYRYQN